mgnify:CR=1 FL=1
MVTGDDLRARRANSFGAHAPAYAQHRPDYPAEAIRWVLEPLADGPRDVLDLAAAPPADLDVIETVQRPFLEQYGYVTADDVV